MKNKESQMLAAHSEEKLLSMYSRASVIYSKWFLAKFLYVCLSRFALSSFLEGKEWS